MTIIILTLTRWRCSTPPSSTVTSGYIVPIGECVARVTAVCCHGEVVKWRSDVKGVSNEAIGWWNQA